MKTFRAVPSQAVCGRCANLFAYHRRTRPRVLCTPCIPFEKQETNNFYNKFRAIARLEARRNAIEAHGAVA